MSHFPSRPLPRDSPSAIDQEEQHIYPTLKQSLSAATRPPVLRHRSKSDPSISRLSSGHESEIHEGRLRPTRSSFKIGFPAPTATAELAFVALQCLITPLLVLSSSKTLVLANDAMRSLLAWDAFDGYQNNPKNDNQGEFKEEDTLYGLSLSQVGIELVQEENQEWPRWEVVLHALYYQDNGLEC